MCAQPTIVSKNIRKTVGVLKKKYANLSMKLIDFFLDQWRKWRKKEDKYLPISGTKDGKSYAMPEILQKLKR